MTEPRPGRHVHRMGGIRGVRAALTVVLAVLVSACALDVAPTLPSVTPAGTPTPRPTDLPGSIAPSAPPGATWRIGVLTSAEDSPDRALDAQAYDGAVRGAAAVGAAHPTVVQATSAADAELLLAAFAEQGFDVIVVSAGLDAAAATAARANPDAWYIGVDHDPCIDATGAVDPGATECTGDIATLLPNYIAMSYAEDQAGYLAGIVAASVPDADIVGAVGGVSQCGPCIRYLQGYELGARSVDPEIRVDVAWVSDSDPGLGFGDQSAGRAFGQAFIAERPGLDVVMHIAGTTGLGVIDAACGAGIHAIGSEVDQHESYPASGPCILTSAEKRISASVVRSMVAIAADTAAGGRTREDASTDGIGVSPLRDAAASVTAGTQARIDEAIAAMRSGTLVTCPADTCGSQDALPLGD